MVESDFLQTILDNPADDTRLLVYADWLEESGDAMSVQKAEFLRLTIDLGQFSTRKSRRTARKQGRDAEQDVRQRLQSLAAALDTNWLAAVSRLQIENCPPDQNSLLADPDPAQPFQFLCPKRWEALGPTAEAGVRTCEACQQNVYYCDTITSARRHAERGHCVAIDLGVIRRERDLEPQSMMLGMVSPDWLLAEDERLKPDPVSAEREQRMKAARRE